MPRIDVTHCPDHHVSTAKSVLQHIRMEGGSEQALPQYLLDGPELVYIVIEHFYGSAQRHSGTGGDSPGITRSDDHDLGRRNARYTS